MSFDLPEETWAGLIEQVSLWISDCEHVAIVRSGFKGTAASLMREALEKEIPRNVAVALQRWGCPADEIAEVGTALIEEAIRWRTARDAALIEPEGSA